MEGWWVCWRWRWKDADDDDDDGRMLMMTMEGWWEDEYGYEMERWWVDEYGNQIARMADPQIVWWRCQRCMESYNLNVQLQYSLYILYNLNVQPQYSLYIMYNLNIQLLLTVYIFHTHCKFLSYRNPSQSFMAFSWLNLYREIILDFTVHVYTHFKKGEYWTLFK